MTPTPAHPTRRYGLGAVNWHTGETVALTRRRPRRAEVAELLMALLEKHPRGLVYVAWDKASTHEDHEIEAVLRGAAGRLVLPYLPTDRPWLNPIEMLWRHFRREVTHGALFEHVQRSCARRPSSSPATTARPSGCAPSSARTPHDAWRCP